MCYQQLPCSLLKGGCSSGAAVWTVVTFPEGNSWAEVQEECLRGLIVMLVFRVLFGGHHF
eukprot:CAMPEP_0174375774 /NCGR_PEP_ID=MMETSP0811_2-20130205/115794_1 /TAXON_ID=73025 ORGANISM="Eutreptiella gymnastica-like, Strain CCMP1594" /NCGR_SAMPLE_ID=MMETSP0811_2 /ASSEMBLY_ACC=CAM_ASM_000667 /LENGTH=59 /DNA_ID=CAMNT_0015526339 /DNA_START=237 /DNA_END=413 /DNA_ORIENTATION=-